MDADLTLFKSNIDIERAMSKLNLTKQDFLNSAYPDDIVPTIICSMWKLVKTNGDWSNYCEIFFEYSFTSSTYSKLASKYDVDCSKIPHILAIAGRRIRAEIPNIVVNGKPIYCGLTDYLSNSDCSSLFQDQNKQYRKTINELLHDGKLSSRTANALYRHYGLNANIHAIILGGKNELKRIRGLGQKSYWEVVHLLVNEYGQDKENWRIERDNGTEANKWKEVH